MRRGALVALIVGATLAPSPMPRVTASSHTASCSGVGLTVSPPIAVAAGGVVRLHAVARCPRGARWQFAFFLRVGQVGPFALLRGWGRSTLVWRTGQEWPGTWTVAVRVKLRGASQAARAAHAAVRLTDGVDPRLDPRMPLLPPAHPAGDIGLGPDFRRTCAASGAASDRCRAVVLMALDRARGAEGLPPLEMPLAIDRLTPAELLLVLVDEERVARDLTPVQGLTAQLDGVARVAARVGVDVAVPRAVGRDRIVVGGTNWARDLGPLAATYDWLYEDGPGPVNLDCPLPGAAGCWGHRDTILRRVPPAASDWLVMGAAQAPWPRAGEISDVEILAAVRGARPALVFSWARALRLGF
ncbi:MAG TPA: hypothetical protein VMW47_05780 [Verrucomicrobiae bacterium]|nr:hypothetical protein [Verrucomicrobiae bacterium]